jgi:aryl-alcohol dehydrogenase-like predicted oxidoreductase
MYPDDDNNYSSDPKTIVSKNFWYTIVKKQDEDEQRRRLDPNDSSVLLIPNTSSRTTTHRSSSSSDTSRPNHLPLPPLPVVPHLDSNGRLPHGSYFKSPIKQQQPVIDDCKQICRIQIAWNVWGNHDDRDRTAPRKRKTTTSPVDNDTQVDIPQSSEIQEMVQTMQQFVDAGFTSFQCQNHHYHSRTLVESHLYRSFWQQTPGSITQQCRVTIPLFIISDIFQPLEWSTKDPRRRPMIDTIYKNHAQQLRMQVRNTIVASLERMQCDGIDDLQIQCAEFELWQQPTQQQSFQDPTNTHNYYLEVLDILQDLQREGLIREISARHLSEALYSSMQQAGLADVISMQQTRANLVSYSSVVADAASYWRPTSELWMAVENPLAGGWLTDRYVQQYLGKNKSPPQPWKSFLQQQQLSVRELGQWEIIQNWARRRHPQIRAQDSSSLLRDAEWQIYQQELMDPLIEMSRKYGVSVASIVLRWTLQQSEHPPQSSSWNGSSLVSAVVVGCHLGLEQPRSFHASRHSPTQRIQQLREVLRFRLEDEDMEWLNRLASSAVPPVSTVTKNDADAMLKRLDKGEMVETAHGLLIPGTSSAGLWDR